MAAPDHDAFLSDILDRNPRIDRQVVRDWQRLDEEFRRLGGDTTIAGDGYRITAPFAVPSGNTPAREREEGVRVAGSGSARVSGSPVTDPSGAFRHKLRYP